MNTLSKMEAHARAWLQFFTASINNQNASENIGLGGQGCASNRAIERRGVDA
jgi:hypothetical protein